MSASAELQTIPLNKLTVSKLNVRRTDRKADIDALAASISSHGLLQNLSVVPTTENKFEVVAGGRRLAALMVLAKSGAIARDYLVPCNILDAASASEASLTENVHRVAMDVIDEVEAFAALNVDGQTAAAIAQRFGVDEKHVEQRLALASLSPKIKAAWKRGDINLECMRAFCIVEDHARQDAVFRSLGRPVTHAGSVRARLMEGSMRANDRVARFVGLEAYERAGGRARRDLFDSEAVFIDDPSLMYQLAEKALGQRQAEILAEGWSWVEISVERQIDGVAQQRVQSDWREPTAEEQAELDRLRTELEALDEALDADSIEDDPRWETRDDLTAAIETIRQTARVWDPALQSHSGALISIDHDGQEVVTRGLVRIADEKIVRSLRKKAAAPSETDVVEEEGAGTIIAPEPYAGMPKSVLRELSSARSRAIRLNVARNPVTAFAIAVAGMLARSAYRAGLPGIDIAAHAARSEDHPDLDELRQEIFADLPQEEDILAWALGQPTERLMGIMSLLVAGAIDLSHERGSDADRLRREQADTLTEAMDINMRSFWSPDADYWAKLPKAELLAALSHAPRLADASVTERDAFLATHAKMKKGELAVRAQSLLGATGYLPDLLITNHGAGAFELIDAASDEMGPDQEGARRGPVDGDIAA